MTFLVIGRIFSVFACFYDDEKNLYLRTNTSFVTPFFTQFVLSHASNNITSPNIEGTDIWAVHPPQILGTVPPSPPISLRLWEADYQGNIVGFV